MTADADASAVCLFGFSDAEGHYMASLKMFTTSSVKIFFTQPTEPSSRPERTRRAIFQRTSSSRYFSTLGSSWMW